MITIVSIYLALSLLPSILSPASTATQLASARERIAPYLYRLWSLFALLWVLWSMAVEQCVAGVTTVCRAPRRLAYLTFFPTSAIPYRAYPLSCALLQ